jgi:hypothetical protein
MLPSPHREGLPMPAIPTQVVTPITVSQVRQRDRRSSLAYPLAV